MNRLGIKFGWIVKNEMKILLRRRKLKYCIIVISDIQLWSCSSLAVFALVLKKVLEVIYVGQYSFSVYYMCIFYSTEITLSL